MSGMEIDDDTALAVASTSSDVGTVETSDSAAAQADDEGRFLTQFILCG